MWNIDNLAIDGRAVLAPMAGITSLSYRSFMKEYGTSLSFTEMVSDCGIIYGNEETFKYTRHDGEGGPVGLQLFGSDPDKIKEAISILNERGFSFDLIDINMGCPVPKVTKTGAGSALMKDPIKAGEMVRAAKAVSGVPVTAKIRLGWDDAHMNFLEVVDELEKAGASMISIHARTAKQLYGGEPRYELLAGLRERMSVPLVVSGNIYSLDDAICAIETTHADGVMIARGGMGNPTLVRQIDTYFRTGERLPEPTTEDKCEQCLKLARLLVEEKGEDQALRIYRSIGPTFFHGLPNSRTVRNHIARDVSTLADLEAAITEFSLLK